MVHLFLVSMICLVSSLLIGTGLATTVSTEKNDKADNGWKLLSPNEYYSPLYNLPNRCGFNCHQIYSSTSPKPMDYKPNFEGKQTSSDDEPAMPSMTAKDFVEFYNSLSDDEKHAVDGISFNWQVGYQNGPVHIGIGGGWTPGQKQHPQQQKIQQLLNRRR